MRRCRRSCQCVWQGKKRVRVLTSTVPSRTVIFGLLWFSIASVKLLERLCACLLPPNLKTLLKDGLVKSEGFDLVDLAASSSVLAGKGGEEAGSRGGVTSPETVEVSLVVRLGGAGLAPAL